MRHTSKATEAASLSSLPELPPAPPSSTLAVARQWVLHFVVVPVLLPVLSTVLAVVTMKKEHLSFSTWRDLYHLIVQAQGANSIAQWSSYQDPTLLARVYQQASAKPYTTNPHALEFQVREGYCAGATLRCLLGSFSHIPPTTIPPQKLMPSHPEEWCQRIDTHASEWSRHGSSDNLRATTPPPPPPPTTKNNENDKAPTTTDDPTATALTTTSVLRDLSYDEFVNSLRTHLHNPHDRVAVNYLRSALFGFPTPTHHWFWQKVVFCIAPFYLVTGLFGGHFSPVIGMLDNKDNNNNNNNPLVAIFDVNHKYGGTYLVPARRLYQAVQAVDIATGQSRALIVVSSKTSSTSRTTTTTTTTTTTA